MIDTEKIARRVLRDTPRLAEEISVGDGVLEIWRQANLKPSRRVAIFRSKDSTFAVSTSLSSFERFLSAVRPSLADIDHVLEIFRKAGPGTRVPIRDRDDFFLPPQFKAGWSEPAFDGQRLRFFCNDVERTRFEEVEIFSDYRVVLKDRGEGVRFALR